MQNCHEIKKKFLFGKKRFIKSYISLVHVHVQYINMNINMNINMYMYMYMYIDSQS